MTFKHNDPDCFQGKEISLHDCIADRIFCQNEVLRFCFPEGIWITPSHPENGLQNTVRTDAAIVDLQIRDMEDVVIRVFVPGFFGKTYVRYWSVEELMKNINSGKYTLEFISLYRAYAEQLWICELHSAKKPYFQTCQIHLPETEAVFRWNELRSEYTW